MSDELEIREIAAPQADDGTVKLQEGLAYDFGVGVASGLTVLGADRLGSYAWHRVADHWRPHDELDVPTFVNLSVDPDIESEGEYIDFRF